MVEQSIPKKEDKQSSDEKKSQEQVSLLQAKEDVKSLDENMFKQKKIIPFSSKDIILAVINLISVVLLIIILTRFPKKAEELKELRIEDLRNESGVSFEFTEVETSKVKKEELLALFLDEGGVVEFVSQVERLKASGYAIDKISFVSQEIVEDKTGNHGAPVVIEMSGSWETLGQTMQAVDALDYLFRSVNISASLDENNLITLKYGGFLYVSDRLVKN